MSVAAKPSPACRIRAVAFLLVIVVSGLCGAFLARAFADSNKAAAGEQGAEGALYEALFLERQKAVVAVEGIVRNEVDRDVARGVGLVIDGQGRIVLPEDFLPGWVPPSRFGNFKVRLPGEAGDGVAAVYLGQSYRTGWHYVQVEDAENWGNYRSISDFGSGQVQIGQPLWGIALRNEGWDYLPYLLSARMSASIALPWMMGFADRGVASPGSAVFDGQGRFVGWATDAATKEKMLFMESLHSRIGLQSLNESDAFITADAFAGLVGQIPSSPQGDRRPWVGITGLQPLDRDVTELMGLAGRGALVVSDVVEGSPAALAGLRSRDIITAIDGEALPALRPTFILPKWLEQQLLSRQAGDLLTLSIVRGGGSGEDVVVTMGQEPTPLRLAEREYYPRLGLTARAFNLFDSVAKLQMKLDAPGVIADFIRPNGLADSGGLMPGDWILAIDGNDITDFASAKALLAAIEQDTLRDEFVLLVRRNNETKVLRIKLH